ncbi:MAG: hypothetical protein ACOH18_02565 [Candidatus Saccharimonadaceae bacterium]
MSSTPSHNPEVGFAVVDKKRSRRAYALSPDQIWWICAWVIPALIVAIQWFNEDLRPLAIIGFAGCAFAWKTHSGIIYRNFQADFEDLSLKRREGSIYNGDPRKKPPLGLKVTSIESDDDLSDIVRLTSDDLDPEDVESIIRNASERSFKLGTIFSTREKTDTVYISGTGLKGSNGDPADVFEARKGVADGFSRAIGLHPKPPSICMLYSRRPVNMIPQILWDYENIDPDVQKARQLSLKDMGRDDHNREQLDINGFFDGTTVAERQKAALDLARGASLATDEEVTQLIAISFNRPRFSGIKRNQSLNNKLTPSQLRRFPIKRLAEEFAREMENAGVNDAHILDRTDVNKLIATSTRIADIQQWQNEVLDWALASETQETELAMPTPWSRSIVSGRGPNGKVYAKHGETFHRTLQVAKYKKTHFFADDLMSLYGGDDPEFQPARYTGFTIAFCGDVIDVERENKILTRQRAFAAGVERTRRRGDEIDTPEDTENRESLAVKQSALWYGGVYALVYNVYFTVSAMTLEMLDEAEESIRARGRSAGVEFDNINNEMRHARSLMTGLFGVNMINR